MIALLALGAAASANPQCDEVRGALAKDQCLLNQSMEMESPPDCKAPGTQLDMNVCSWRDYLRADIELNKIWDVVATRTRLPRESGDTEFSRLLEGQRAWLTYRDRQCSVWAKRYNGGSVASLFVNNCMTGITKVRVKELKQMLDEG